MNLYNLNNFKGGWIFGDFNPSIIQTNTSEVSIKRYKSGESEPPHYHLKSQEITVVISGEVSFNGHRYKENDIILVEKGEIVKFDAITDAVTCVIKIPSVKGDKYVINIP